MKPPTNRLDQTLNTLRYILNLKQPPVVRWRNLLAIIQHGKPMTGAELEFAVGQKDQGQYLRLMEAEGLLASDTPPLGMKLFYATPKGLEEARKLIEGISNQPTEQGTQPDMAKVRAAIAARE